MLSNVSPDRTTCLWGLFLPESAESFAEGSADVPFDVLDAFCSVVEAAVPSCISLRWIVAGAANVGL